MERGLREGVEALVPGRVIAIRGTLDKRDDTVRATASNAKLLEPDQPGTKLPNESDISRYRFAFPACGDDRRIARGARSAGPQSGKQRVQLVFERADATPLRVDVGNELCIDLTPELEAKLAPWLEPNAATAAAVAERAGGAYCVRGKFRRARCPNSAFWRGSDC